MKIKLNSKQLYYLLKSLEYSKKEAIEQAERGDLNPKFVEEEYERLTERVIWLS